ncbi:ParA family protein [Actinokineospora sp. NBRC 105648]|uniref:ParA family protein n=1 Tax=Actinokineospora sp. NBRC 105648 TaxID=3032206 RepID=UPI0024A08F18|nr:ParA family protein [Actinokineospora sp. NBRC 105648]GLZ37802.1 hypothetical protein Acsp05_14270 [Actinokineospora sp. NBRC 105648]
MRARVICLASAKGGSGKTMLTASLATFVGSLGRRVLIVDTDAATNGLTLLYLTQVVAFADTAAVEPEGLFDADALPVRGSGLPVDVVPLSENVDLLPATFVGKNTEDVPVADYAYRLRQVLTDARSEYDLVLLDAQAGADEYARVAVDPRVSDRVLIVSEYDPMSAAGVERLKVLMGEGLAYARTWIVLNKMLPEFAKSFGEFLEIARYAPPIPWDAAVVRAYARRSLALDLEYGNEHTVAIMRVLGTVIGEEIADDLDRWADTRVELLREPIKVTAAKLRSEVAVTESLVSRRRRVLDRWRQVGLALTLLPLVTVGWLSLSAASLSLSFYLLLVISAVLAILGVGFEVLVPRLQISAEISTLEQRVVQLRARLDRYEDVEDLDLDSLVTHPDRPRPRGR